MVEKMSRIKAQKKILLFTIDKPIPYYEAKDKKNSLHRKEQVASTACWLWQNYLVGQKRPQGSGPKFPYVLRIVLTTCNTMHHASHTELPLGEGGGSGLQLARALLLAS